MLDLAWRPRAHLDRESIAIYLSAEKQAPEAAYDTLQRIDKAIDRVRKFPDSGGHFTAEGLHRLTYRTVLSGPYTVFYRYDRTILTVYRIVHQRQNIDVYALVDLP